VYIDLNLNLTSTQTMLKEELHRFAAETLRPASIALDKLADPEDVIKEGSVFWDVFKKFYELEYHLALVVGKFGAAGELGGLDKHILAEEAGWGAADLATGLGATTSPYSLGLALATLTGNQRLMDDVVTPFLEDREAKNIGCWAITEPQHGSDAVLISAEQFSNPQITFDTYGRRDGDDWIINGAKSAWVSNGTVATHGTVHFAIDKSRGMIGTAIATMPLNIPGVTKGKPLNKLGQRALNQGEIFFDDVRIPKEYVVVEPELYTPVLDMILCGGNLSMACAFTGLARAAFEEAMTYCKQRTQGGKPLCEHQLVQRKLFDMFTKVEAARALSRAVSEYNSMKMPPVLRHAIAAKVFATEASFEVASDAVQLFGGYGLSKDFLIEKLFRDARASTIEDGVNDVLALASASSLIDTYVPER